MELRQLKTFTAIAHLGSFSKAARKTGYAQSTITGQIQQLEQELGTHLFERLPHRTILTSQGQLLLPYAEQIVELAQTARESIINETCLSGTVTIGTMESVGIMRLTSVLEEFHIRYPHVDLRLQFGSWDLLYQALREGHIDVAFLLGQHIQDSSCTARILFDEPMYLLAAPEHPLASRDTVEIGDLSGQTLILAEKGCSYRTAFENTLAQYHVLPAQVLEVESIFAIKKLVASNLGITYMPAMAVQDELHAQSLIRLPWGGPDYHIKTLMIHKKNKWISPALKTFFSLIRERFSCTDTDKM